MSAARLASMGSMTLPVSTTLSPTASTLMREPGSSRASASASGVRSRATVTSSSTSFCPSGPRMKALASPAPLASRLTWRGFSTVASSTSGLETSTSFMSTGSSTSMDLSRPMVMRRATGKRVPGAQDERRSVAGLGGGPGVARALRGGRRRHGSDARRTSPARRRAHAKPCRDAASPACETHSADCRRPRFPAAPDAWLPESACPRRRRLQSCGRRRPTSSGAASAPSFSAGCQQLAHARRGRPRHGRAMQGGGQARLWRDCCAQLRRAGEAAGIRPSGAGAACANARRSIRAGTWPQRLRRDLPCRGRIAAAMFALVARPAPEPSMEAASPATPTTGSSRSSAHCWRPCAPCASSTCRC